MITEANRRGGLDNITAIVVRIESVDSNTGEHAGRTSRRQRGEVGPTEAGERDAAEVELAAECRHACIRSPAPAGLRRSRACGRGRCAGPSRVLETRIIRRAPRPRGKLDRRLHQPLSVAPPLCRRLHRHLGQLERPASCADHGTGAPHAGFIHDEEDLTTGLDDPPPPGRAKTSRSASSTTNQRSIHSRFRRSKWARRSGRQVTSRAASAFASTPSS